MLKLMAMNLYDMEGGSRMENLVAFKKVYAGAMQSLTCCLENFSQEWHKMISKIFSTRSSLSCSGSIRIPRRPISKKGHGNRPYILRPLLHL